jgi:hypothetical protein
MWRTSGKKSGKYPRKRSQRKERALRDRDYFSTSQTLLQYLGVLLNLLFVASRGRKAAITLGVRSFTPEAMLGSAEREKCEQVQTFAGKS